MNDFNWNEYDEVIAHRDMGVTLNWREMQDLRRCSCEFPFFVTTHQTVRCKRCDRPPMLLLMDGCPGPSIRIT